MILERYKGNSFIVSNKDSFVDGMICDDLERYKEVFIQTTEPKKPKKPDEVAVGVGFLAYEVPEGDEGIKLYQSKYIQQLVDELHIEIQSLISSKDNLSPQQIERYRIKGKTSKIGLEAKLTNTKQDVLKKAIKNKSDAWLKKEEEMLMRLEAFRVAVSEMIGKGISYENLKSIIDATTVDTFKTDNNVVKVLDVKKKS